MPRKCHIPSLSIKMSRVSYFSSGSAARTAAPVFKEIGRRTLEYLGIPPDDPYGYPKGDPRHDSKKADMAKEIEALEVLYKKWNGA